MLARRLQGLWQTHHYIAFGNLVFQLEHIGIGRHQAPVKNRTGLIQVGQMPVTAFHARTDVKQVRTGTHGAQQVGRIVKVIARCGRTAPATCRIKQGLTGRAWLLAVTVQTAVGHVLVTPQQLLGGIGLQLLRRFRGTQLPGWQNHQHQGSQQQHANGPD